MKLLRIDSSARATSVTRQLTARFAEEWLKRYPGGEIAYRDLSTMPLPQITDEWSLAPVEPAKRSPGQKTYLTASDQLIEELRTADTIVIGAPMYNFSISSSLKAWVDQIVRIGETFSYGPSGWRGLLERKQVVVITARGGSFEKGTANAAFDFQEPYLRHIVGLIGITDITFIHAENQLREGASEAFAAARESVDRFVADKNSRVAAS